MGLAELARTIADNNIDDDGSLAVLGCELLLNNLHEVVVQLVGNQVDGTATETTAHDAAAGNALFLGNLVEEIKLFA